MQIFWSMDQRNPPKFLKNFKYIWIRERKWREKEVQSPRKIKQKWKCNMNIWKRALMDYYRNSCAILKSWLWNLILKLVLTKCTWDLFCYAVLQLKKMNLSGILWVPWAPPFFNIVLRCAGLLDPSNSTCYKCSLELLRDFVTSAILKQVFRRKVPQ